MRQFFTILLLVLLVGSHNTFAQQLDKQSLYDGTVKSVTKQENQYSIQVELTSGNKKDQIISIQSVDDQQFKRQNVSKGDKIIVSFMKDPTGSGKDIPFIFDHSRKGTLLSLFFLFLVFVFGVGRWKGFFSFLGMIFSFLIIAQFIVPQIVIGNDPLLISLFGALFIIPVTFYISHGMNAKTTVAVIGTFFSLALTGTLAYIFVHIAKLTGFAAEEAIFLQAATNGTLDIKNLLLAGIVIGAMGVLDDITISQTAIVEKLAKANPKYTMKDLFIHGMDVGRDHIASLVNTLILVYTGAALPLFLLFSKTNLTYMQLINQEIVATEIVRTLVSSIGIIAAVPITTVIAAYVVKRK